MYRWSAANSTLWLYDSLIGTDSRCVLVLGKDRR